MKQFSGAHGERNSLVRMSGAHVVIDCIKSNDVEYIFGIGGQSIIPILDILSENREIQYLSARHEQIATYMADGYARYSGKPGVVFVSRAGGASNTVTGVVTAYSSDSPVVIIAGMPPIQNQGRGDYQDFDLASVFRPITKFSYQVEDISKLQNILYRAFRTALSGRPGPVFIGIPTSILLDELDVEISASRASPDKSERKPPPKLIQEITDMLLESKSPAIMAGNGITLSDAHGELIGLSETFAIPVMPDYGTLDIVPTNHPLLIRDMGALTEIDLLLVVGTNIAALSRWPKTRETPRIIQIELDESQIGKVFPATIGVAADLKPTLKAIIENLEKRLNQETKNNVKKRTEDIRAITERLDSERWPKKEWDASPIRPWRLLKDMRDALSQDTIITRDSGSTTTQWFRRLFEFTKPKTCYRCLGGVMGFALPGALGIKLADPTKDVVALVGDGSFTMVISALTTSVQYDIPITILIINNSSYMQVKKHQEPPYLGSELVNPDLVKLAESFKVYAERVEKPDELKPAIKKAIRETKKGRTALLDVVTINDPRYATHQTYFR